MIVGASAALPAISLAAIPTVAATFEDPILVAIRRYRELSAASDAADKAFVDAYNSLPKDMQRAPRAFCDMARPTFSPAIVSSRWMRSHEEIDKEVAQLRSVYPRGHKKSPQVDAWAASKHAEFDADAAVLAIAKDSVGLPALNEKMERAGGAAWDAYNALYTTDILTLTGLRAFVSYSLELSEGMADEERALPRIDLALRTMRSE